MRRVPFEVVFDIAQAGYRTGWFPLAGVPFVLGGTLWIRHLRRQKAQGSTGKGLLRFAYFWSGFSLLWVIVALVSTASEYRQLRRALTSGRIDVTEGRVQEFVPGYGHSRKDESFRVCGIAFSYSDNVVSAAFNQTHGSGGPLREGLWVRISHVGDAIVRLEVAREAPGEATRCTTTLHR